MVEGFLGEVFVSLTGGVFLTGMALLLGAGPVALSLLSAVPLLAQVTQLLAPSLERRLGSKRRFVVPAFALGRLLWLIPAGLVVAGLKGTWPMTTAVLAVAALSALVMVATNGWLSWMAEVVPARQRARHFGRRAWAVALATLMAAPLGGLLVDGLGKRGEVSLAYGLLGLVAVGCGAAAAGVLRRFPPDPATTASVDGVRRVIRRLFRDRRYRQVVGLFSLWNLAIGLPAPFWTLYMLQRLGMSFFLITLHTVAVLVVRLITNDFWSRVIDRVGSHRVLIGCGLGVSGIPLIWLLTGPGAIWPIWIEAVIAGICWTGFNQAAFIQPMAVLEPHDRSQGLALLNVATGFSLFSAALLGGLLLQRLGTETRTGFFVLFGASSVLRLSTSLLALRLTEPGLSVRGFLFNFVGYGVLRRPSIGRQWLSVDEPPPADDGGGEG